MEAMKKAVHVKGKAVYDVETLFSRLMVVGHQRNMDVADVLQFELSPVPPALIDEYGCLRKCGKSVLVKCLGVSATNQPAPDVVLVDAGQLLYHVVWPVAVTAGDLGPRLSRKTQTRFKTNLKLTVLNNTKLHHF